MNARKLTVGMFFAMVVAGGLMVPNQAQAAGPRVGQVDIYTWCYLDYYGNTYYEHQHIKNIYGSGWNPQDAYRVNYWQKYRVSQGYRFQWSRFARRYCWLYKTQSGYLYASFQ